MDDYTSVSVDSDDANPASADAYTGYWERDAKERGRMIDLPAVVRIPGAVILRYPSGNSDGHVVICDEQDGTVEA